MREEVVRGLFESIVAMLPSEAAFVLVVIPKGGNGAYSEGGEVISNVGGGEAVADVLHAVAEEQKRGRFFDEAAV